MNLIEIKKRIPLSDRSYAIGVPAAGAAKDVVAGYDAPYVVAPALSLTAHDSILPSGQISSAHEKIYTTMHRLFLAA